MRRFSSEPGPSNQPGGSTLSARPQPATRSHRPSILIAGSGLAGLTAALRAEALGHDVTLVTKGPVDESNTRYAQGGIAAAVFADDSPALHVDDTLVAGAGLSVLEAVRVLCSDGPQRIEDLVRWGVQFDRVAGAGGSTWSAVEGAGPGDPESWARGLEAAHSRPRVLHAGGDATGAAIVAALVDRLRASRVTLVENAFVTDLLLGDEDATRDRSSGHPADRERARRVVGVELLLESGARARLTADAVVLATGGAGQLFEFTTNPLGATGDGLAAAWRAGARVDDVEFYQFHPTALAVPGSFLVSEAVRGEGAVLLDASGRRFMAAVDRRAELAPRDIVARGIAEMMKRQAGLPALLDATGIGASTLVSRFPTITAATRAAGLDWTTEPIPVTPAAHYFMGGVSTDLGGRTSLPGLYAVGEVASTGVHGANRLASNSLLEAAVFGWRAVEAIVADAGSFGAAGVLGEEWSAGADTARGDLRSGDAPLTSPFSSAGASTPPHDDTVGATALTRAELQRLMWSAAGVERTGAELARAAEVLASAEASGRAETGRDASASGAAERDTLETANLLDVGRLVVRAALAREESRGAHYRSDFPVPSDEFARALPLAREVPEHAHR